MDNKKQEECTLESLINIGNWLAERYPKMRISFTVDSDTVAIEATGIFLSDIYKAIAAEWNKNVENENEYITWVGLAERIAATDENEYTRNYTTASHTQHGIDIIPGLMDQVVENICYQYAYSPKQGWIINHIAQ